MKKLIALAGIVVSALLGSLAVPTAANATVTCVTPTVSGGLYPQNYLWICQDSADTPLTNSEKNSAIAALGKLGGTSTSVVADAETRMSTADHYVYLFKNIARYQDYCQQVSNPTPTPVCSTIDPAALGTTFPTLGTSAWQSLIFRDNVVAAGMNNTIGNTAAHEVGHQLDVIYGQVLYGGGRVSDRGRDLDFKLSGMKVTISGTAVAGHQVKLTFEGEFVNPSVTISYTVQSGDTLQTISNQLVSLINSDSTLTAPGVKLRASNSGTTTISVLSDSPLMYGNQVVGTGVLLEVLTQSEYDWDHVITRTPSCAENSGVFSKEIDDSGRYICGDLQKVTVSGTIHAGDVMRVTFTDTALGGSSPLNVDYTVPSGANAATVAAGISNAINLNSTLANAGLHSLYPGSGGTFRLTSQTRTTSYSVQRLSGTTTNIALSGGIVAGGGDELTLTYDFVYNSTVLQNAWSYYFQNARMFHVGGTLAQNDQVNVIIRDPALLGGGVTVTVPYTLGPGEDRLSVAYAIADAINNDGTLSAAGITASAYDDSESVEVKGLSLGGSVDYSSTGTTTVVVDNPWQELFAELTAISAGQQVAGNQTPDDFLAINVGNFTCSQKFVQVIQATGALPTPSDYNNACK